MLTSAFLILLVFFESGWIKLVSILFLSFTGFCLNFFRDPHREIPEGDNILISSADGKVVKVEEIDSDDNGEKAMLVSVFLSVFNVHANRVPLSGTVKSVDHKNGKFLAAFNHKASDENERSITVYDTKYGKIVLKQIAGLIARRILNYSKIGDSVETGNRMGFIMFGSRTDLIFPTVFDVRVRVGEHVIGGETIIAEAK